MLNLEYNSRGKFSRTKEGFMKIASFGANCPFCHVGTMVASALISDKKEFQLFFLTSDGEMCFDGICSNCQAQFQISYPLTALLFFCLNQVDKDVPRGVSAPSVFKIPMTS